MRKKQGPKTLADQSCDCRNVEPPTPAEVLKPKGVTERQARTYLRACLSSAVSGEYRHGLHRVVRSTTYLVHMSCVAANAGLTDDMVNRSKVQVPEPTTHYISAHYEGLLSALAAILGHPDDIVGDFVEALYDPCCARCAPPSRATAMGVLNFLAANPGLFDDLDEMDKVAQENEVELGSTLAEFSAAGVRLSKVRLAGYVKTLANGLRFLRDGSQVAAVSPGGVFDAEGRLVVDMASVLSLLGELIDVQMAVSALLGLSPRPMVPAVDLKVDELCQAMMGVRYEGFGRDYGPMTMERVVRGNAGKRTLGLLLSEDRRDEIREEMGITADVDVVAEASLCKCPRCSSKERRFAKSKMREFPGLALVHPKPAAHKGVFGFMPKAEQPVPRQPQLDVGL